MDQHQGTAAAAGWPVSRSFALLSEQARGPSAVIDLAGGPDEPRRGGHDPEVPQILFPLQVRGKLLVGHTADLADPDAPILLDPGGTVYPGTATADLRCGQCVAKVDFGELDGATLAVLGHQAGCRELARMLRAAELA